MTTTLDMPASLAMSTTSEMSALTPRIGCEASSSLSFEIAHREPSNECIDPPGQWPQFGTVRAIAQEEHAATIGIDPVRQLGQVGLDMRNLYSRRLPTLPLDNGS